MPKYKVISADPPWRIKAGRPLRGYKMGFDKQLFSPSSNTARETEYPSMTIEQIKSVDVKSVADENCLLFLWVTSKHLPNAFEVVKAWGFNYSTTIMG